MAHTLGSSVYNQLALWLWAYDRAMNHGVGKHDRGKCSPCAGGKGKGRRDCLSTREQLMTGRSPAMSYFLKFPQAPSSAGGESFNTSALWNIRDPIYSRVNKNQTESQNPYRARDLIPQAAPERHSSQSVVYDGSKDFPRGHNRASTAHHQKPGLHLLSIACRESEFSPEAELHACEKVLHF